MTRLTGRYENGKFFIEGEEAAKYLRIHRLKLGIKQQEVAKYLKIDGSYFSSVETGKSELSMKLLEKLLCYYCIKLELEVGWNDTSS